VASARGAVAAGHPTTAEIGARVLAEGGNAVDAACAMLAATCTMFDVLSWGGETQALIYNPKSGKVIAINALGVAPTGATAEFFRRQGMNYPPQYGPLAAVTPGTPGGLMVMLAEFGTLSLAEYQAGFAALRENKDRIVADTVAARLHWRAEQFLQLLRRRQKPHRLHDLALGPAQVRHQDGLAARLQDRLDRRQALANARVARDLQVLVERHVEVDAHEHALLVEIEVRELLGHGATDAARNRLVQRWAAIFFVRSTTRLL
jgi:gamma-glutamyltranspeptidase